MKDEEILAQLQRRRNDLLKRLASVRADIRHETEPLSADSEERAVQGQNDQVTDSIGLAAADELVQIDEALQRLATHRYGICEGCHRTIEPQRLASIPYAVLCSNCAERP